MCPVVSSCLPLVTTPQVIGEKHKQSQTVSVDHEQRISEDERAHPALATTEVLAFVPAGIVPLTLDQELLLFLECRQRRWALRLQVP